MLLKLLVVGKLKDRAMRERCETYLKWLGPYGKVELHELPDSTPEREGQAILKVLERERGFVAVLSEEGQEVTSVELASKLGGIDRRIVLVIGGPEGLAGVVKRRADWLWSLSKLTLTHEMARLLLCEQLFRASTIQHGGKYHNP